MSYDLLAFESTAAPRERSAFRAWWTEQSQWTESHGYADPTVSSPSLRQWYAEITQTYPNMNGPDVNDDEVSDRHTDYSIGTVVIYGAFAWSEAEEVYPLFRSLAVKHGVGFYDVSGDEGDGEIHFPGDDLQPPSSGKWREISAHFRAGTVQQLLEPAPSLKRSWRDLFRRK